MKSSSDFIREYIEESRKKREKYAHLRVQCQKDIYKRFGKRQCEKYLADSIFPFDINPDDVNWKLFSDNSKNYSTKLLWYEITTTHPDKSKKRKDLMVESLIKYCEADSFEGHFEIGKGGLYHYHFKVGTHKYLRKKQVENINDKYRVSCSLIHSMENYNNYIIKKPENVAGWEDI